MSHEHDELRDELDRVREERDVLRRELGNLRAHASIALGIVQREPGPDGLEVLSVPDDKAIVAAIRKLAACSAPAEAADGGHRWTAIDDDVLKGRKIPAIQQIRREFGSTLGEALDLLGSRYEKLRRERPDEFLQGPDSYWDGFYS